MDFVFDPGLVLYLPLYQPDGASLASKDIRAHLCTATGASWRPNGRYFDGTDDVIVVPDTPELRFTGDFTIAFWSKLISQTGAFECVINKRPGSSPWLGYHIAYNSSASYRMRLHSSSSGSLHVSTDWTPTLTEFYFYCITFTGGTYQWYVNGQIDDAATGKNALESYTEDMWLGKSRTGGDEWANIILGEVLGYNRALTPLEIKQIHDVTKWRYR